MSIITRVVSALVLALVLAFPAWAQTDEQRAALAERIESFDAAMRANDMTVVMGVVPPKVMEEIAKQYSVSVEDLIAAAQTQIDEVMANVKLESFGMDLDSAEFATLADGTLYALIPTETVMDLGETAGGKIRATSQTLGLLDGETWYLVRVEDAQQVAIVKQIYPAFAAVEFPHGSMEPVTE